MSTSSGSGGLDEHRASSSTSSAQQPDPMYKETSNEQSTSQVSPLRQVNNERDAGASTSFNPAVNDETRGTGHSLQDLLASTDIGEQHQLILDAQGNAPSATYVPSAAQLPTDDGTPTLCDLDLPQASTPQLPADLQSIPETQLMRLQSAGDPSESHPCPSCNVVCGDLERLRRHAEIHEYRFACPVCGKLFPRHALLIAHVAWAHPSGGGGQRDEDNGLFPCGECEVVCADAAARERHAGEHTYQRTCSICNKRFARNEQLAAHACASGVAESRRIYSQRFECSRCGAKFARQDLLDQHMRAHQHLKRRREGGEVESPPRRVVCGRCDFECRDEEALRRHMATHAHKLVCLFCDQRFEHDEDLTAHVLTEHPPEEKKRPDAPPFVGGSGDATTRRLAPEAGQFGGDVALVCQWPRCGKTFTQAVNLARHAKIHTGEKQFACPFCRRKFTRSDARASHVRRKHKKNGGEDGDDEDQL